MELWKHQMKEDACMIEFTHGASQSKYTALFAYVQFYIPDSGKQQLREKKPEQPTKPTKTLQIQPEQFIAFLRKPCLLE